MRNSSRSRFLLVLSTVLVVSAAIPAQGHHERRQDDPLPGARRGDPTASRGQVQRGPFISRQVNVDANGNNVPSDAGNEPSLALDPNDPGRVVVGWRQFDNIASNFRQAGWGHSGDGGATWTFPGSIQAGTFNSDPVLDVDAQGRFYYLAYPNGRVLTLFRSTDGGQSWGPGTSLTGGDKAWMIVDRSSSIGRGHVYVIWQVVHGPNTFTRSTDGGASFSVPVAVPSTPTFGNMATDSQGNVFAAGLERQTFNTFVCAKSTNAKDAGQTPSFTRVYVTMGGSMVINGAPNPGGLLGQAEVCTDPTRPNAVYMLCSVNPPGNDPMDVHFVRSTDGGQTFSAPVRLNDDPPGTNAWQWLACMAVSPTGRIDVAWNDTRNGGGAANICETYYAFSLDGGTTWSRNIPVSPAWNSLLGHPNQNKIGDYYDLVSTDAVAHLAYSGTFNGEQDVYYLALGDCNRNGTHDGVDIRDGTSYDANENVIPDECETCQRSLGNGNGVALSVCGDDLATAGSRATLAVSNGISNGPVFLVLSPGRLDPPFPLPGGGALVPDPVAPGSFVLAALSTNGQGRAAAPVNGGSGSPATVYVQAVMIQGVAFAVSNALEVRIGS
jgi:hypothetical protein